MDIAIYAWTVSVTSHENLYLPGTARYTIKSADEDADYPSHSSQNWTWKLPTEAADGKTAHLFSPLTF